MTDAETNKRRATHRRNIVNRYKRMRGCIDCGYKKHHHALEFDHIKDIKAEIRKCVVRCSNCHMIRTRTRHYRKKLGS